MDKSNFGFVTGTRNPISTRGNNAQASTSRTPVDTPPYRQYEALLKAVDSGDLDAAEKFLADNPEAVNASITSVGETALHIAIMLGRLSIVEKLLQLMSKEDLELTSSGGLTALHFATFNKNNIKAAKWMVEKNERLVTIPDAGGWLPVATALRYGHTEVARYLYSVTPIEALQEIYGAELLLQCFYTELFDIALDLIKRCPRLAVTKAFGGFNFLMILAQTPSLSLNETELPFWKRWLHTWFHHVHQEPAFAINEVVINVPETTEKRDDYVRGTSRGLLHQLVRNTLHLLGIKKTYEARLAHKQSLELLHAAFDVISTLNEMEIEESQIHSAVLVAAEYGNPKFIVEAVKVHLPLVWSTNAEGMHLFCLAVGFRQAKVFNLIHGLALRHVFSNTIDFHGNSMLHMAGFLAPPTQLNHISGALLQMQRELQWFKEVESIVIPGMKESLNSKHITPRDLFTKQHRDLVTLGETWTKGAANSCSVVVALVATITFAAAFTVPGGNDQTKGYPIFLHEKLFMLFIISDTTSLFSSTTSLLMFLGLLTSRYAEEDFLKSLPRRLIIGLSTMFISLAAMMIAFCAALFLMLQNQSWIAIPVTVLASIPVTLYIWLQFPLLVEIFKSTYGSGIFDRNVKPWP